MILHKLKNNLKFAIVNLNLPLCLLVIYYYYYYLGIIESFTMK